MGWGGSGTPGLAAELGAAAIGGSRAALPAASRRPQSTYPEGIGAIGAAEAPERHAAGGGGRRAADGPAGGGAGGRRRRSRGRNAAWLARASRGCGRPAPPRPPALPPSRLPPSSLPPRGRARRVGAADPQPPSAARGAGAAPPEAPGVFVSCPSAPFSNPAVTITTATAPVIITTRGARRLPSPFATSPLDPDSSHSPFTKAETRRRGVEGLFQGQNPAG